MDFSESHLSRYLAHKLGRRVEVRQVERFSRGTSRQTWFVTLGGSQGNAGETFVFRIDHPTGSIEPTPLSQEYFMYARLGETAIPIARALWWEEDPTWTGRPFYVREKVAGSWNVPHFLDPDPQYDELRIAISQEHMRKLAIVHSVDWRALRLGERLPAPADEASCGPLYVDTAIRQLEEIGGQDLPVMLEAAEWLKETAPIAPRICLCKGTNGFGEEIWRGREIVAMSDWEEASIGDPAADFAFMQYLAPELERKGHKIWGLSHALDYYRQVSGIAVTVEAVRFYGVIRAMRLIIMAAKAGKSVTAAPERAEIRQAWTATEVGHVCRRSLIAAMGLTRPPPASVLAEFHETIEAPL
jgi:aminoglycoside phosphotransferase (APT) family kinase protein